MIKLNPWQVASLRIFISGLVLLPLAWKKFKQIPFSKIPVIFLSGALGSLIPAYLFCLAEEKIDSSLAGALNSMTPIFVILTGVLFFGLKINLQKTAGVFIAFCGSALLFLSKETLGQGSGYGYSVFIFVATLCYGLNVNLVQRYLKEIPSLDIVAMALTLCGIPALVFLIFSGFFALDFSDGAVLISVGYTILLGVLGTSIASILFYQLIKQAGSVFASMVTYGIPLVAICWGKWFGEGVGRLQILGLLVILSGVYLANAKSSRIKS